MTTLTITTTGMRCRFCPKLIEKKLEKLAGVQDVMSDYEHSTTVITFDPEWVSIVAVVDEIEEAGFGAPRIAQKDPGEAATGSIPRDGTRSSAAWHGGCVVH